MNLKGSCLLRGLECSNISLFLFIIYDRLSLFEYLQILTMFFLFLYSYMLCKQTYCLYQNIKNFLILFDTKNFKGKIIAWLPRVFWISCFHINLGKHISTVTSFQMEKMIVAMAKSDGETGIVMRAKRNLFSDQIESFSGE